MNSEAIKIIKSDERGIVYDCAGIYFVSRKKDSITADHQHGEAETIFLVRGEIELTVGGEVKILKAPVKFSCPGSIYHKLVALTDIEFIKMEE